MRKVTLSLLTLVLVAIGSTNSYSEDQTPVAKMEAQNMALVRHVHAEVAKGNMGVFDEALKPDYVRHCQAMPPGQQELHGTKEFVAFVADFMANVSDYHESIDLMMADSNMVAYVTTMRGVQTGPMGGLPATGKKFELVKIIIHRFEDGKIAETWVSWDNLAMLNQLGLFPPPAEGTESEEHGN